MNTEYIKTAIANKPITGKEEALKYYKGVADEEGKAYCENELRKIDEQKERDIQEQREIRRIYFENQYNLNK